MTESHAADAHASLCRRLADARWINPWTIFGIGLGLRWIAFYYFYFMYVTPGGLPLPATYGEAGPYEILARQLMGGSLEQGLFGYRPPLQPMFIALVYLVADTTNPLVPAFVQTVVSALIILLAYALARELGAPREMRLLAGFFVAVDPASIIIGLYLMAETLSNVFLAVALVLLARALRAGNARDAAASGGCLALATLARPTSIYFFVVVLGLLLWLQPRKLRAAAVFLGAFALCVAPWYLRNYIYHGAFTFSAVGEFDLLYYKAVQVEHWATREDPLDIQTRFAYEVDHRIGVAEPFENYDYSSKWRHLVPDEEIATVVRGLALEVFLRHPLTFVLVTPVTVIRMLALTSWLDLLGPVRWLEVPFNLSFYALALLGLLAAWSRRDRVWLGLMLATLLYFFAVPVISSGSGVGTRTRTIFTVGLAVMAAEGVGWLWKRWQPVEVSSAELT